MAQWYKNTSCSIQIGTLRCFSSMKRTSSNRHDQQASDTENTIIEYRTLVDIQDGADTSDNNNINRNKYMHGLRVWGYGYDNDDNHVSSFFLLLLHNADSMYFYSTNEIPWASNKDVGLEGEKQEQAQRIFIRYSNTLCNMIENM